VRYEVIGVSTTAEFVAKGAYENTIGRLARWTASADTPEDKLIQEAHTAYGDLIYYEPWYRFPFGDYVEQVWSDTPFFGKNFIRKVERKLMFSGEFAFKALHAKAIGFGAATAYDAPVEQVIMHVNGDFDAVSAADPRLIVLRDFGEGDLIVSVPRWGPFTEIVSKLAASDVRFVEIAGNDEMLVTAVGPDGAMTTPAHARLLFESMVISPQHQRRAVYVVGIEHLGDLLNGLAAGNNTLEHVFDF
jgi:hypothetical protein